MRHSGGVRFDKADRATMRCSSRATAPEQKCENGPCTVRPIGFPGLPWPNHRTGSCSRPHFTSRASTPTMTVDFTSVQSPAPALRRYENGGRPSGVIHLGGSFIRRPVLLEALHRRPPANVQPPIRRHREAMSLSTLSSRAGRLIWDDAFQEACQLGQAEAS
jgi:hypothetical protein